jgi:hypothetical protein
VCAFPVVKPYGGGVTVSDIAPNLLQWTRTNPALFTVSFFDDAPNNTIPSVPANPAEYPSFTVVDPTGVQLVSGVGIPGFFTWFMAG